VPKYHYLSGFTEFIIVPICRIIGDIIENPLVFNHIPDDVVVEAWMPHLWDVK
jgi:hypothetical protein